MAAVAHRGGLKCGAWAAAYSTYPRGSNARKPGYQRAKDISRSTGAIRDLDFISLLEPKRVDHLAAFVAQMQSDPNVDYVGLDYMRSDRGGYEMVDRFTSEMPLRLPAGFSGWSQTRRWAYVAGKIDSNTRELEGAVTRIQGMAQLQNGRIDIDLAKAALGEAANPDPNRISIQAIMDAVTKYYNVRLSDLQSKKRHKSIAFPRQVCMYLARKHTRYSLEETGGYFGGRDHTTVLHAVRTVNEAAQADAQIAEQLRYIESQLTS
jgi:hypothetical protein